MQKSSFPCDRLQKILFSTLFLLKTLIKKTTLSYSVLLLWTEMQCCLLYMVVTITERELPNKCSTRSRWLHIEGCTNISHSQLWLPHIKFLTQQSVVPILVAWAHSLLDDTMNSRKSNSVKKRFCTRALAQMLIESGRPQLVEIWFSGMTTVFHPRCFMNIIEPQHCWGYP